MLGETAYICTKPASEVSGVMFMNATGCVAPLCDVLVTTCPDTY